MHTYSVDTLRTLALGDQFYASLWADYQRTGGLTARQIECLGERELPAAAPQVTTSHLERAFANARATGLKQPSITLMSYRFMPADPARARPENRNAIFVTHLRKGQQDGDYLGKVLNDRFVPAAICNPILAQSIVDAMEDPFKACVEYGRVTGNCSVCNRPLTNEESVKYGIGPVCRQRFGW